MHRLWTTLWSETDRQTLRPIVGRKASTPFRGVERPRVGLMERHGERVIDVGDSSGPPAAAAFEQVVLQASPELRRWLDNAKPLNVHEGVMIIAVPSNFARNLLEVRFRPQVETTLTGAYGRPMKIMVTVDDGLNPSPSSIELDQEASRDRRAPGERAVLDRVRDDDEVDEPPYDGPPSVRPRPRPPARPRTLTSSATTSPRDREAPRSPSGTASRRPRSPRVPTPRPPPASVPARTPAPG